MLVDFNDTKVGLLFRRSIEADGIEVVDYLKCMCDLGMVHTYLSVDQERDYVIGNINEFMELISCFEDDLSRFTIFNRLKTFITLDRSGLIEISQPAGLFSIDKNTNSKLFIGKEEVYVDAGAAHGDTVANFYEESKGLYKKIYAFEPDPINYKGLEVLAGVMPNIQTYPAGLSNVQGEISFYEQENNRFGSRFIESNSISNSDNKVKVMRLDDVVEKATILKIDVEGFESKVIEGASRMISKYAPSMHISGYHYPGDLCAIINQVKSLHKYKNIVVRHYGGSIYDTNILFSDRQNFSSV